MTDFSTTVAAGGDSYRFVYDNAKNLFYFAVGGDVFSYDPLTGTKATLLTVEGTIGGLAMTSDGDHLLVGMKDIVGDPDPMLWLGTVYRVPMATPDDAGTYETVHFQASYLDVGVFQLAMASGDELLVTNSPVGSFVFRIPAESTDTVPINWNEPLYGGYLTTSEHGRYVLSVAPNQSPADYQLYDNSTHTLLRYIPFTGFYAGRTDISEASGLIVTGSTFFPLAVYDLNFNIVADLTDPMYGGHIQGDAKFNTGGHQLFLWNIESGQIEVVDATSWTTIGTLSASLTYFDIGSDSNPLGVSADGHFLYRKTGENFEFIDLNSRLETTQTGTTGDDVLYSTQGQDTLDGGDGFDKASYEDATAGVTLTLASQGVGQNTLGAGTDTLTNIEGLVGSSHKDSLSGNSAANMLDGGAGADTLKGGDGDDTYIVDDSGDVVVELLNKGTDLVEASASFTIGLNIENLTLTGVSDIDGTGNGLANIIVGNSGNNRLDGKGGADSLTGGSGDDTYVVDNVGDVVTELADQGVETVEATVDYALGANVENLRLQGAGNRNGVGNELDNVLIGNSGANALKGLVGKDFLDGGTGADRMYGGADDDTYVVDNLGDIVVENTGEGTDVVQASVSFTLGQNVENLTLTGSDAHNGTGNALVNTLTGNAADNQLDGKGGADNLIGGLGNDSYVVDNTGDVVTELADQGVDTVIASVDYTLGLDVENLTLSGVLNRNGAGNSLNNILTGNAGNNHLNGREGADTLVGGLGNDVYTVDNNGDTVTELLGEGADTVLTALDYTLGANVENLILTGSANLVGTGNSLANILNGNDGDNRLDGRAGLDTLAGGLGNDTYVVDNAGDVVTEIAGHGVDTVETALDYTLGANLENLTLTGLRNANGIGNSLNNALTGNARNNILKGLDGADTIDGAGGMDSLYGGLGSDTFVFKAGSGTDFIRDFSTTDNDMIDIHAYTAGISNTALLSTVGGNTLIDLGGGNTITVIGIVSTNPGLLSHIVW